MRAALHHIELWTVDFETAEQEWRWLLTALGWSDGDTWARGCTWTHPDGTYIVLEQSRDMKKDAHDRLRASLNHLAITCLDEDTLTVTRMQAADHGWRELFADRYPHAGGPSHRALFLENAEGFEVEIVVS